MREHDRVTNYPELEFVAPVKDADQDDIAQKIRQVAGRDFASGWKGPFAFELGPELKGLAQLGILDVSRIDPRSGRTIEAAGILVAIRHWPSWVGRAPDIGS